MPRPSSVRSTLLAPSPVIMAHRNGTGDAPEMEKINTHIVTLTRFLTEEQSKHKEATGDFT